MLRTFREEHSQDKYFRDDDYNELMAIKHIVNENRNFSVKKCLKELYSWKFALYFLESLKKKKYDRSNSAHEKMLLDIWHNLMPS